LADDHEARFALECGRDRLAHGGVVLHEQDAYLLERFLSSLPHLEFQSHLGARSRLASDLEVSADDGGPLTHALDARAVHLSWSSSRIESPAVVGDLDPNGVLRAPHADADPPSAGMAPGVGERLADD